MKNLSVTIFLQTDFANAKMFTGSFRVVLCTVTVVKTFLLAADTLHSIAPCIENVPDCPVFILRPPGENGLVAVNA